MHFTKPLIEGILDKRYHRFLADITLENGDNVTAHCTNTGSMKGVLMAPQRAWISMSTNPNRKLPYTLEILETPDTLVGVNTHATNKLAREGLEHGVITNFGTLMDIKNEVAYGASRLDFLVTDIHGQKTYIEVKNVSLKRETTALFPDSVTERGTKHLLELMKIKEAGGNAAILFIVQRSDVESFAPAEDIDPVYAKTLKEAIKKGVHVVAYKCLISSKEITVYNEIPVIL